MLKSMSVLIILMLSLSSISGCSTNRVTTEPSSFSDELAFILAPTPRPAVLPETNHSPSVLWQQAMRYKEALKSCNLDKVSAYELYKAQLKLSPID